MNHVFVVAAVSLVRSTHAGNEHELTNFMRFAPMCGDSWDITNFLGEAKFFRSFTSASRAADKWLQRLNRRRPDRKYDVSVRKVTLTLGAQ